MDLSDLSIETLDLDLEIPASRGRKKLPLVHCFERELGTEDILLLIENPDRGSKTPAIIKLKQSHHKLAQLLAEGVPDVEVALITGYAQSRISILKTDPAFKELLAHYKGVQKEIFINVHERLSSLSLDALEELQGRLEEKPEAFSVKQLQEIIELGFDRSGFGPRTTQVNELHLTTDSLLSSVRDEIRKKSYGSIKTLDAQSSAPNPPRNFDADLGLEIDLPAGEYSDKSRSGDEGGGAEVREAGGEKTPNSTAQIIPFSGGPS